MSDVKERFLVSIDNTEFDLNLSRLDGGCLVEFNGDKYRVSFDQLSGKRYLFKINENSSEIDISRYNGSFSLFLDGHDIDVRVEPFDLAELRKRAGISAEGKQNKFVVAPMPGLVLKTEVGEGDEVRKGTPLFIIEAMKMENIIKASADGKIKKLFVSAGQAIDKNDKLVEFE